MAKKSAVETNERRRKLAASQAAKRARLKATVNDKTLPIEGVQFHPESIMTGPGNVLLHNFLRADYAQLLRRTP